MRSNIAHFGSFGVFLWERSFAVGALLLLFNISCMGAFLVYLGLFFVFRHET